MLSFVFIFSSAVLIASSVQLSLPSANFRSPSCPSCSCFLSRPWCNYLSTAYSCLYNYLSSLQLNRCSCQLFTSLILSKLQNSKQKPQQAPTIILWLVPKLIYLNRCGSCLWSCRCFHCFCLLLCCSFLLQGYYFDCFCYILAFFSKRMLQFRDSHGRFLSEFGVIIKHYLPCGCGWVNLLNEIIRCGGGCLIWLYAL